MDLAGITLPDNVHWADESEWTAVLRQTEDTVTGAVVVDVWERQAGRPITLTGMQVSRSLFQQCQALEADPDSEPMTLTLPGGEQYSVLWRQRGGEPAVQGQPLFRRAPNVYGPNTTYSLELRLQVA